MKSITLMAILFAACMHVTLGGLSCSRLPSGKFEFKDGEEQIEQEEFDCMRVAKEVQSTLQVNALQTASSPRMCSAIQDGVAKTIVRYEKVDIPTGIRCNYICKEQSGLFRCVSKPLGSECPCDAKKPTVVVKPVASELGVNALLGGQSESKSSNVLESCKGKEEGYQFPDAVPCVSLKADVTKKRVHYIGSSQNRCRYNKTKRTETRYTKTSPDSPALQGCISVCKRTAPTCITNISGTECVCKSSGLRKQLVPLDELSVKARIVQTDCVEGKCGPCGVCGDDKRCHLRKNAFEENVCPCGEICPRMDERQANFGGQIGCEPNVLLECMARPPWMGTPTGKSYEPGKLYPDLCTDGDVDRLDTCNCAEGYEQMGGKGTSVLCMPTKP